MSELNINLNGKMALVTGGSTGIGRAIAIELANAGCDVIITSKTVSKLNRTIKDSNSLIKKSFVTDLRNVSEMEKLTEYVNKNSKNGVDIIVNAAGVWHNEDRVYVGKSLWELSNDEIQEVMDVGIMAPMILLKLLLPKMIKNKSGKIINISGTFSSGGAGWLHYYVSKLALEKFTIGISDELRPYNIQVNCISPSDTKTDALIKFFPEDAETAIEPDEIAQFTAFLSSSLSDNITGQTIVLKNKDVY